jgi:hypothetical protein
MFSLLLGLRQKNVSKVCEDTRLGSSKHKLAIMC